MEEHAKHSPLKPTKSFQRVGKGLSKIASVLRGERKEGSWLVSWQSGMMNTRLRQYWRMKKVPKIAFFFGGGGVVKMIQNHT